MNKFACQKCGSPELSFEKWIKCKIPVVFLDNDHIEYDPAEINEEIELCALSKYACKNCGQNLSFCGENIETEKDLIDFLSLDAEEKRKQEEMYKNAMMEELEKGDGEIFETYLAEEAYIKGIKEGRIIVE